MEIEVLSTISILVVLASVSILYPLGDAMKIKWAQERERQALSPVENRNYEKSIQLSNRWHAIGFWLRTFALVGFVFAGGLLWGFVGLLLLSLGHNIIIQLGLHQPIFKVGTTAKTDIFLRKVWSKIILMWTKVKLYFKK